MKKALLMALCLLIAHSVFAYDYLYNGVYYNLDHVNQTATVTYSSTSYNSYSGTVNIPDYITTDKGMDYDVVAIGDDAFRGSYGLTSVTIATGIETIGNNGFDGCSSLTTIKLPNTVTTLGFACFRGCSKVTEVTFSSRITAIPQECFYGCSALKNVTLPKNVTTIGNKAFSVCSALADISFSTVLTNIGNYAFQSCSSLSSVTLPSSVLELGSYAFEGCSKISAINLNEGLVKMGDYALANCTNLTEVSFPSTIETIGERLFAGDRLLANVTMNCQVTVLPAYTFDGCSALTIVTLPSALTIIGNYAFQNCSKLPSVIIPATLITVEPNSFSGCNNLKQITFTEGMITIPRTYAYAVTQISLPESATAIADNAFYGCSYISSLLLPASISFIGKNAFSECSNLMTLEYAEGTTTALRTYATKLTKVTIPSTCHTLADNIFDGCTALSSVYISDLEMWNHLFLNKKTNPFPADHYLYLKGQLLTNLIADFGVPITNFAFANTKGLKSVTLTGSITEVSDNAFSNSTNLQNVVMGNGVKSIGNNAFLGCNGLESIRIGVAVKEIGNNAFYGCNSLNSVRMGGQEQSIGDGAFKGCVSLPSLKLPTTVRTIGTGAFEECKALTKINLPEGMTTISDKTFYNCVLLPEISIPSSVTTIGSDAFYNCSAIELLELPNSVEKIGKNAFSQCVNLNFATVGTGVTTIESGAFANCSMLKAFYCLATAVPTTDSNSFSGSKPESITLYVPNESVTAYKSQSPWKSFATALGMSAAPTYANNIVLSPEVLVLDDNPDHENYIRATVSPSNATNAKVTWTSSNTSVATVSRTGLVSPIMEGVATITATASDKHGARATALVIVANKFQPVTSLSLDKTTLTLTEGEQLQLIPTTLPATASYDVIAWTSSDDNIATVSEAGIITAMNQGYADIIATTSDGTKLSAVCKLTVDAPATPELSTVSDANGDGIIDANDITAVKNHILGRDTSLGNACDVNGDGNITMADVAAITAAMKGEGGIITGPVKFIGLSKSYDIVLGESKTITPQTIPYRAGNHVEWSIDDKQIASITTLPNGSCVIKPIATGQLTLTASANDGSGLQSTTVINITPNCYGNTNGYQWVDLGLPSGTLWAAYNVGATVPEDYGHYIAWGELAEKDTYDWSTYSLCNGSATSLKKYCTSSVYGTPDNKIALEAVDDVATAAWGESWTMPTNAQLNELFNNDYTTSVWTTKSGVYGCKITSKQNGCSVFLPAAGYKSGSHLISESNGGYYASKNFAEYSPSAYGVNFGESTVTTNNESSRCYGLSIRPVTTSSPSISTTIISKELELGQSLSLAQFLPENIDISQVIWSSDSPDIIAVDAEGVVTAISIGNANIYATYQSCRVIIFHIFEYIDLGLPSGTKWATCNVGAEKAEDYGEYFAWGETRGYKSCIGPGYCYKWYKYIYSEITVTKYCNLSLWGYVDNKTILDLEDDAAHVNWGGSWRMPTRAEQDELRYNCTWTWTTQNGVNGYKVTSKSNGNSIFLPAAGYYDHSFHEGGSSGQYWASSLTESKPTWAFFLYFQPNVLKWYYSDRSLWKSVRAVCP